MAKEFIPGVTPIPASGAILEAQEKDAMISQVNKGWITASEGNKEFERRLAEKWGTKYCKTCNSGSSANLIAVASMVESERWKAGDEIIVPAVSFPTTVNPLLHYGLIPVFVDVDIGTYNATYETVADAFSDKTKGIMLAHTLGHPFPRSIIGLALLNGIQVIEDSCDAFGASWNNAKIGSNSTCAISTCSFFPAHHITTGEGGATFTNDAELNRIMDSVGAWGRDCYCDPGAENTCGQRFNFAFDGMPEGYDHKYTYTHLGFNLKMTEIQAVCGLAQLDKLDSYIAARNKNWKHLLDRLKHLEDQIHLPEIKNECSPSWFGFCFTIREPGQRLALQEYLASHKIGSRLLFGGNITRQPYMKGRNFRVSGTLTNADKVMEDSIWIGVWPGLTREMLDYVADKIEGFFA